MKKTLVTVKDFKGISDYPDTRGPENGFVTLTNCYITNQGTIIPRQAFDYFGTLTYTDVRPQGKFSLASGSIFLILAYTTATDFLTTSGALSWSVALRADLVLQYNDLAYLFRSNAAFGTTPVSGPLTTMGFTVPATVGIVHKSRMFVTDNGITSSHSSVRYSDLFTVNAPNTSAGWPVNNTVDVNAADGNAIIAMVVLNDTLIIFKTNSTWALYTEGEPPWTLREIHSSIGCIGRYTPVVIGGMIYFMSNKGVMRTDGTTFENIQTNVEYPVALATLGQMNYNSAVEINGKYVMTLSTGANFEVYNIEKDVWSTWAIPSEIAYGKLTPLSIFADNYFFVWAYGTSKRGFYYAEVALTAGSPPQWKDKDETVSPAITITTKMTDFELPNEIKTVKSLSLSFTSKLTTAITVSVTYLQDSGAVLGPYTATIPTSTDVVRNDLVFRGPLKCYDLQTKIEWSSTGYVELNSISYDIVTSGSE